MHKSLSFQVFRPEINLHRRLQKFMISIDFLYLSNVLLYIDCTDACLFPDDAKKSPTKNYYYEKL